MWTVCNSKRELQKMVRKSLNSIGILPMAKSKLEHCKWPGLKDTKLCEVLRLHRTPAPSPHIFQVQQFPNFRKTVVTFIF